MKHYSKSKIRGTLEETCLTTVNTVVPADDSLYQAWHLIEIDKTEL